jgi:hypothetical protein
MQIPWKKWVFREKVTETHLNDLSDLINQPPFVKVKKNATQNITAGTSWQAISWNVEDSVDPFNMWVVGNPTIITISHTAYYDLYCKTDWPQMTIQDIYIRCFKNNTTEVCRASGFGSDSTNTMFWATNTLDSG